MKRKIVIIIGMSLVIVSIFAIFYVSRPTYGNDYDAIKKIISRNDIITKPISIIDIIDVKEYRIAGFVDGGGDIGYSIFKKDKNNNYRSQSTHKNSSSISAFYHPFFEKENGIDGVDIIISNNPDFAKVKRVINDKYIDERESNGECPVIMLMEIDIPESEMQERFYYYDIDGNSL